MTEYEINELLRNEPITVNVLDEIQDADIEIIEYCQECGAEKEDNHNCQSPDQELENLYKELVLPGFEDVMQHIIPEEPEPKKKRGRKPKVIDTSIEIAPNVSEIPTHVESKPDNFFFENLVRIDLSLTVDEALAVLSFLRMHRAKG